jgi:drug/metabolite transporter (DMT)-like permease
MLELALELILISALLHAGWNLFSKASFDSLAFMWWMYFLGAIGYGLILLPMSMIYLATASVLPFLVSALAETGYVLTLAKGYERGDLSLVYPVSRGGAPILTALWAALLFGERLPTFGIIGILLSVAGVYFLSISEGTTSIRHVAKKFQLSRASTWALASALFISVYSVSDNFAVVSTPPAVYIWWVFVGNAVFLVPFVWRRIRIKGNVAEIKSSWTKISVAGTGSLLSYLLVLFALKLTSVSYVVTGRALSLLFAAILGALFLREKIGPMRVLGATLMILGMAMIAVLGS